MKVRFLVFLLALYGCETKTKNSASEKVRVQKTIPGKIETVKRTFFVGDVNNDKINDTAFVSYKWNVATNEMECGKTNCAINIEFKKTIPQIPLDRSLGVFVLKIDDLNNDHANEILVFSRTNEGWWNKISVWSFKNKTWQEIAATDTFITEDNDFQNRICKEKNNYYLIGESKWEEDEKGNFKKVKVKL